jgi:hypothetical protein
MLHVWLDAMEVLAMSDQIPAPALLPCPFCEEKAAFVPRAANLILQKDPSNPKFGVSVICGKCGSESPNVIDEALAAAKWNRRAASPVEPVAPLRMLTEDEYQALVESEENDFLSIGYVALEKVIQRKFCEVNGLTIGQPVAPSVQEPVAWQFRTFYGPEDNNTGWSVWYDCTQATAELFAKRAYREARSLYTVPASSSTPAEPDGRLQELANEIKLLGLHIFGDSEGPQSIREAIEWFAAEVSVSTLPAAPGAASPDKGMK